MNRTFKTVPRNEDEHWWLSCGKCGSPALYVLARSQTSSHIYSTQRCENCGRKWITIARFETSRIIEEGELP